MITAYTFAYKTNTKEYTSKDCYGEFSGTIAAPNNASPATVTNGEFKFLLSK